MTTQPTVDDLPETIVAEPDTLDTRTGDWCPANVVVDEDVCRAASRTELLRAVAYCPDGAVDIEDGVLTIDRDRYKGAGVILEEAPEGAVRHEERVNIP